MDIMKIQTVYAKNVVLNVKSAKVVLTIVLSVICLCLGMNKIYQNVAVKKDIFMCKVIKRNYLYVKNVTLNALSVYKKIIVQCVLIEG